MDILNTNQIQDVLLDMLVQLDYVLANHNIRYSLDGGTLLGAVRHKGFIPWDDDIDIIVPRPDFVELCSHPEWAPNGTEFLCPGDGNYLMPYMKFVNHSWLAQEDALTGVFKEYLWIDIFPADCIPDDSKGALDLFRAQQKASKKATLLYHDVDLLSGLSTSPFKAAVKRVLLPFLRRFISPKRYFDELSCNAMLKPYGSTKTVGDVVWSPYKPDKPGFPIEDFDNLIDLDFVGHKFKACPHWDEYLRGLYGDYMQLPPEDQRVTHGMRVWKADSEDKE